MRNRTLEWEPKTPWRFAAERSEAVSPDLSFSKMCSRQESNPHQILRKDPSYPLNDGSKM